MPFAEVNGTSFHYHLAGFGKTVVLLHAGIADCRSYEPQFTAFSAHYQTLTYDFRGYGFTERQIGKYSHHEDLLALLAVLGVEKISLVGTSMGGQVAINFALLYPHMVDRLVLVGPSIDGYDWQDPQLFDQWDAAGDAYDEDDLETTADIEIDTWVVGRGRHDVDPALRSKVKEMLLNIYYRDKNDREGDEQDVDPPAINRLDFLLMPTLLLVGEYDLPDIFAQAELLQAQLPHIESHIMPDVGHLPHLEDPALFNQLVLEFLARPIDT